MKKEIISSLLLTALCIIFCSGVYALAVLGIAQCAPGQGKGLQVKGKSGSYYSNIGQRFTASRYFWSRPSAVAYNAAGSGGSNKGPSNPEYLQQVAARRDSFLLHNPGVGAIPSDMLTASGSGLDPDISIAGAMVQVPRIAKERNIPSSRITALIQAHTQHPLWGLFGPQQVNVLALNLALDQMITH